MSAFARLARWLEDQSDVMSPLVVKEVRQVVRGREFMLSFSASLVAGLGVAFFGAVDALSGSGTAGRWTFPVLLACLAFLGLAVVPLGAFTALRSERVEQTLDLITLTALSPRRIVIGKLLAQTVKLGTLFAAITPFLAMSFLLGGIDLVTIFVAILVLFLVSIWSGALFLMLSALSKARAMSVVVFAAAAGVVVLGFAAVEELFSAARRGMPIFSAFGLPVGVTVPWGVVAAAFSFWFVTLVNLVLLAAHRLSQPNEDSVTPLRMGFFAQLLLAIVCALAFLDDPPRFQEAAALVLAVAGSLHLAVVAYFVMGENLAVPRRVLARMRGRSRWRWLLASFGPGGGRAAAYVLAQFLLLLGAVALFRPPAEWLRWLLAASGYICFFTAVPAFVFRRLAPARATPFKVRVAVLGVVAAAMVLPDLVHYVIWRPEVLDLALAPRHLVSPVRTLAEWQLVERRGWFALPFAIAATGLFACLALVQMGARAARQPLEIEAPRAAQAAGELPATDAGAGAAGAKPPGVISTARASGSERVARTERGIGVPASERVGGSAGAKPPGVS